MSIRPPGRLPGRARTALIRALATAVLVLLIPASARAGTAYAINQGDSNIAQYSIGTDGLLSVLVAPLSGSGGPTGFATVNAGGTRLYVADQDGGIEQYAVNPQTGALSPIGVVAAPAGALDIAIAPDQRYAYVTAGLSGGIAQYDIDPVTGVLSPMDPSFVSSPGSPYGVAVTPDGRSAYVTGSASASVAQFDVDAVTGALSPKIPATVAAGFGATGVAVAPDGRSVYVTDLGAAGEGTVSQYDIDPMTGALSAKTPAMVAAGSGPLRIVISADGRSAYVANLGAIGGEDVSQYEIDPVTGALSPMTPAAVAGGDEPHDLALSPDGNSLYVVGDDLVSQFDVDPATGALSPKTPPAVIGGPGAFGIAVSRLPAPTLQPTSLSLTCSPSLIAPGDATRCSATVTDTAAGAQTIPTGTVSFTARGAGRLMPSTCTLAGGGAAATCATSFTSLTTGPQLIQASYEGDSTHGASSASTSVSVSIPPSTAGCLVGGHGRIRAADGDRGSFTGLVTASPPVGAWVYRDHGPSDPIQLVSTTVTAVTCRGPSISARVFGWAQLNRAVAVQYRIDIRAGTRDGGGSYRIQLSDGYDSGAQPIRRGGVIIRRPGSR